MFTWNPAAVKDAEIKMREAEKGILDDLRNAIMHIKEGNA